MEMNSNGQRESKGSWKPPTRLQKQAPASLNLDHVSVTSTNETPKAIPLLSPLILSAQPPLLETTEKQRFMYFDDDQLHNIDHNKSIAAAASGGGWQHPAVPTFTDPSTLLTFFQSQCMIVNPAQ
ncbi:hypothetical protein FNV43_RR05099 [Rhamnella rubrinervis]|uniref:Uncharacterized protein n=1 Tax=Rhamnella rubrinervis TaxID=2594499 RepID=A0A8K0HKR3_9ROSA|nr:hypothetical protein FNV43_RR13157 [Rhamnella rubrinervis]KAF3454651.1 hypothetical protein FNV43_RR05099 [Rhamnella rubrinervis]